MSTLCFVTLRIFMFLLLQNKPKIRNAKYKCTGQPRRCHTGLFQNQTFAGSIFCILLFISKKIAVQRQSLEYMLPDIPCKSKKEYQNNVDWFFCCCFDLGFFEGDNSSVVVSAWAQYQRNLLKFQVWFKQCRLNNLFLKINEYEEKSRA